MGRKSSKAGHFRGQLGLGLALLMAASTIVPGSSPAFAVGSGVCAQTVSNATGVSVVQIGNECVVTFTTGSITWTVPTGVSSVRALVVGGGGAGGASIGGGGGAGEFRDISSVSVSGNVTVTVGAGGLGGAGTGPAGSNSVFGSITAVGGGGGGSNSTSPSSASNGSGGGGGFNTAGGSVNTRDQGHANVGGKGSLFSPSTGIGCKSATAGGGGGAGTAGAVGDGGGGNGADNPDRPQKGGNGGDGRLSDITGVSTYYAGGGGGGINGLTPCISSGSAGTGGLGGGANGGLSGSARDGFNASANTGGGGGGSSNGTQGGNGGSGVVIVSYAIAPSAPTITSITPGNGQLSVAFSNSSAVTNFEYSINNGSNWISVGSTSSPFTISGLANETAYTVLLRGVNSTSVGAQSSGVSSTPFLTCSPTTSISGGFTIHTFSNTGTCRWNVPSDVSAIETLVAGAGGGGGAGGYNSLSSRGGGGGGGGGGGQVQTQTFNNVASTSLTVNVGAGGAGGATGGRSTASWAGTHGRAGQASTLSVGGTTVTAQGGGAGFGGGFWALNSPPSSTCNNTRPFTFDGLGVYYIDGIGGRGGNSGNDNLGGRPFCDSTTTTGLGGAGAGGAGSSAASANLTSVSSSLQPGGAGTTSSISGSSVEYGTGGSGGGGEGGGQATPVVGAAGSRVGMGGNGGAGSIQGNSGSIGATGGAGANGVVVIRYATPTVPDAPTITSVASTATTAVVNWSAPANSGTSPITNYVVEYSTNNGSTWTEVSRSPSTTTNQTISGMSNDSIARPKNQFRVKAVNAVGISAASAVVNGWLYDCDTRPVVVTGNGYREYLKQAVSHVTFISVSDCSFLESSTAMTQLGSGTNQTYKFDPATTNSASLTPYKGIFYNITLLNAAKPTLVPTFNATTNLASSATIQISNYDNTFTWSVVFADGCSASISNTGLISVSNYTKQNCAIQVKSIRSSDYAEAFSTAYAGQNRFAVTFNGNSSTSGTMSPQIDGSGATLTLSPNAFSRTGYTFSGWNTLANGTGTPYAAGASYTFTANITLYAQWSANSLSVTWNSNGGSSVSNTTVATGATLSAPTPPTRAGYTFAGWAATDGGTAVTFPYTHGQTANFTMYAIWTANTNNVIYDEKGGSTVTDGTFLTGGTVTFPSNPTRAGFIFGGWSATDGGNPVSAPYSPSDTSNITLYAVWLAVSPPTGVTATAGSQTVTVGWTAPANSASQPPTAYRVEYSTTGTGSWTTADATISSSARTYQITGLTNNTAYYVRVAAVYAGVTGAYGYPWTLIFETTTPSRVSEAVPYTSTNGLSDNDITLSRTDFSRVRYYVGARYPGDTSRRYVDANFDKTISSPGLGSESYTNLFQLQVPRVTGGSNSQFEIQGNVSDLDVLTNSAAVNQGIGLSGRLEIWPWNYSFEPQSGLSGGQRDAGKYDDGDSWTANSGNYGSFQLHNIGSSPQTIFAWNLHIEGFAPNIGFGTNTGTHPDWTFESVTRTDFLFQSYANLSVTPLATYTITLNRGANGTGSDQTLTKTHGQALTLPNSASANSSFTRTGYTVTGWSTTDGGSQTHALGGSFTTDATTTLYPVWTGNTYTVTYQYNSADGGTRPATGSFTVGGSAITLPTPTRTGYTFDGWYAEVGLATTIGAAGGSYSPTTTTTIYAKWIPNTYTITFAAGTGATGSNQTQTKTQDAALTLPSSVTANGWFTRSGQTIVGWSTTDGGTLAHALGGSFTANSATTLYPVWTCAAGADPVVSSGLVLRLDADNTCSTGTTGRWRDLSGNSRDMTWVNTPTLGTDYGKYYEFVRSSSHHGTLTSSGLSDFTNGFSITFWARFDATSGGGWERILDIGRGENNENIIVGREGTTNRLIIEFRRSATETLECSSAVITDGQWAHFSITVNSSGNCVIYKNGTSQTLAVGLTRANPFMPNNIERTSNFIGESNWLADVFFDGGIGDLAIYNRALNSTEVSTNYSSQLATPSTYTITLNRGANGTGSDQTLTKTHGQALTLPNSASANSSFTRTGYTVTGWSTTDGGSQTHALGGSFTTDATTTLYPVWASTLAITTPSSGLSATVGQSYTLSIQVAGGTGTRSFTASGLSNGLSINSSGVISGTPTTAGSSTVAVTVTDSTGSKTTNNFTISVAQIPLGNASPPTVTATANTLKSISVSWSAVDNSSSYTIRLYASDGTTLLSTITGASGTSRTITASDYSSIADNTAYQVSIQAIGTGSYSSSAESGKVSVTTLAQRTITFDSNSGSSVSPSTVNPGSAAAKPTDPTRSGFRFAGWSTSETSNQGDLANRILVWPYTPAQSLTLYAIWVEDYSINFAGTNPASARNLGTDANPIEIVPKNSSFTVEAWIKPVQKPNDVWSVIVHNGSPANDDLGRFMFYIQDTGSGPFLNLNYKTTSGKGGYGYTAAGSISYNTWQHVAVTFTRVGANEGSSSGVGDMEYRFFINGELSRIRNSTSTSTTFTNLRDTNFSGELRSLGIVIGDSFNRTNQTFVGEIDQVKVWDGALSAEELNASSASFGAGSVSKTLRAHYGFNDLASTTASSQKIKNLISDTGAYDLDLFSATAGNVPSNISRSLNSFSISYNGNNATSGSIASATGIQPFTNTALASQGNLLRSGFTFAGWRTAANSGTQYSAGGSFLTTYGDRELFANWSANSYAISFNANGATSGSAPSNQSKIHGTDLTLASNSGNLVRTGYTFAGWSTQADGGGTQYAAGGTYTLNEGDELFARWTANTYTVTYTYNGADGGTRPTTDSFTVGGSAITLPTPSRLGFVFGGWYAEVGLSTLIGAAGASYSPTADTTIYAKWTSTLIVDLDATSSSSYSGLGTTWTNIAPGASPASATLDSAAMYSTQFGGVMNTNSNRKATTQTRSLTFDNSVGFTMEVWVRFNAVNTAQGVASYDGGGRYINFYKAGNAGMRWEVSASNSITDSTVVAANTWYHYVGTCKNNIAVLYRNGVQAASSNGRTCTTSQNSTFLVGNIQGIQMDGSVSLFRFYTSALTSDEVLARYNATKSRTTYTVTYNYDSADGGNSTASATYATGDSAIVLPTPTKTNNTFAGWHSDAGKTVLVGNGGANYTPSGATSAITLYAKWTGNNSTVTFNANDGSGTPATSTQSISNGVATALTANAFTRTGYTFAGWNSLANGTGTNYTNQQSVTLTGNLTLYAKWTANTYTVTYTYNGADGGTTPVTGSFTVGGSAITLPTPTRTGYTFAGWYGEIGLSTLIGNAGASYSPTANVTIYAKWTANNNTVTFKSNYVGGANDTTQSIVTAVATGLTSNTFTRTGYSFSGWNTLANGTGTNYTDGQSVTLAGGLTLYAKWTVATYTVTYNYNSATGGNSVASGTFTTGGSNLVLPTPTRTGYTFAGWYDDSGFSGSALASSISTTSSKTIYAKWTAATYTVLYEYNGATSGNTTVSNDYTTASTTITLPTPTRTGYTFAGWFEASNLTGSAVTTPYTTSQNRSLYAKWTAVNYTVTYNANLVVSGNTIAGTGSVPVNNNTYNIGQSFSVAANTGPLTRSGYTFAGWVTNQDGSGTAKNSGETITFGAADINLYPKWTANTYTISYNLNGGSGDLTTAPTSWTVGNSNVTLPSSGFTRTGYNFAGWSMTQGGAVIDNSFSNIGNVTLYAAWTLKSISYTFDKGTAAGQTIASWPSNSSANFGSTITLPTPGNTVTINSVTYQFFGWEYSGTTYQPGSSFTLSETAPTFVAQWVRLFDVRYGYAGGTHSVAGDTDDECVTGGLCLQDQDITLRTAPTRSGYNFIGWRVQDTNTTKAAGAAHRVIATGYLFYANWQAIDYVFSFNSSGGSESHSSVTANIGQLVTMPNPGFKVGYTFAGWSPDGGTTKYTTGSTFTVGTSSRAFVAYWTPNVYTVVYDWQGASGTPTPDASYTVGTGALTLPLIGDRTKDGFTFGGWSETPGGTTAVSNFVPTSNDILYAIWNDGNYTLSYNGQGASAGSGSGTVGRGQSVTLPTPVRSGFVFNGWYDSETGGNKIGNGGQSHTPDRSKTMHARWVQKSLWGVDPAKLEGANEYTASSSTAIDTTLTHNPSGTSAQVRVPAGALPNGTKVNVQYFKDTDRQSALIPGDNSYFFSVLVSWLSGTGSSATVPNTNAGKAIEVTLTNSQIKAGAMVYMVIGDEVRELGRATQDGTVTVNLTEDPEIVVAATAPGTVASVVASSGDQEATISWAAPSTNGGAQITGYTVTASPGGANCTTAATSCTVTGLTNGTAYTFSVVANNSVGSSSGVSSSSITPALATYTVTFNSNGGGNVSNGTFTSGGSVSEPTAPTRSGYTFDGWSTVLNSVASKVTFPYTPGVTNNITLYALWTQVQNNNSGGGGGGQATPPPTPTATPGPTAPPSQIGFRPTPPATPVAETGPVGTVTGSTEKVTVVADAPSEKIIATAGSWKFEIKPPVSEETEKPVSEKLALQLPVGSKAEVSGAGLQPNTTVEAWVFSEPRYLTTIKVGSDGSFASSLSLPKDLLPGQHTLQIGSLNGQGRLVVLSVPITIKGSVSVGTFRGFVAIFTKDLEGQELTAKVAGKWIRQNPIRNFKKFNYSRLVRLTGAGYDIAIDVYINKKFYKRYITKTR